MNNIKISFDDVVRIRKDNRNPDVTFAPGIKYKDITNKSYECMVEIFSNKLKGWYFAAAEQLSGKHKNIGGSNFIVMIIDCVTIDLLSQYYYGLRASNATKFKLFVRRNLSGCNQRLPKQIESCSYIDSDGTWRKVIIRDTADAIYYGFRCSLIHSGRTSEYGRINEMYKAPITIEKWDSLRNKYDIHVNPERLLKEIEKAFEEYIKNLLDAKDPVLKDNFTKKIFFDYGFHLRDK